MAINSKFYQGIGGEGNEEGYKGRATQYKT